MSNFMGGSAFAMARDIGEGYFAVTTRTFKNMSAGDMAQLGFEIDRVLRELRGEQSPKDEQALVQARNRKILRLSSALTMLQAYRQQTRR